MNNFKYTIEAAKGSNGRAEKPSDGDLLVQETIFHTANGYLGVRGCFEEGRGEKSKSICGTYINGFYDFTDMKQAEKLYGLVEEKQTMLNLTDLQGIVLMLDEERFTLDDGELLSMSRTLDMKAGLCERVVCWRSPKGKEIELKVRRMTSFTRLSLFLIDYEVKAVNFAGNVTLFSTQKGDVENFSDPDDPRVAGESCKYLFKEKIGQKDGVCLVTSATGRSGLLLCSAMAHRVFICGKEQDIKKLSVTSERDFGYEVKISGSLKKGESLRLLKYCIFKDSAHISASGSAELDSRCLERYALKDMKEATGTAPEDLYREQESFLESFWDTTALDIEGDDDLTLAVHYNQYQLLQSVGKDEHSSIAAKGLSGEGYEGHFFWDTEMFLQPFFTLTNPELSRNLIAYRYETLSYARENARLLGHKKGALYPWRTIMGKECSGYFPSGTAQYHIDGDIVYSVVAYYLATKDLDFIAEKGAEIVFECARLFLDVGNYSHGSFRLNVVTGPDEYTCMVNNNYYTNASAKYTLHWAVVFYYLLRNSGKLDRVSSKISLTGEEIEAFEAASEAMYLPYDKELGINPQDDSFLDKPVWDFENTPKENYPLLLHYHPLHLYRFQVCKQADTVLAHFIFEDLQSIDVIRKSFLYYEKITTHDSSLSTCIFSIVAAKLGMVDKAYDYLGDSAKLDLFNTHQNTKDGIHTANMGGTYMAVVYGFGGLRLKENSLQLSPCIPKEWKAYSFSFLYEGSLIGVRVEREGASVKTKLTLRRGEPRKLEIYDTRYVLDANGLTVTN